MAEPKLQNNANHTRLDPLHHLFLMPVALANVILEIFAVIRRPTYSELWFLVLSIAFLLAIFSIRTYALKVQDRVIRLEETLRMQRVLPAAQQGEINGLRVGQFVALRFASDAELPQLVEQTLKNGWKSKDIKGAIREWRADHHRV